MSAVNRICECCKSSFTARSADVTRGWARFCSKRCKARIQELRTGQYAAMKAGVYDEDDDYDPSWDAHK